MSFNVKNNDDIKTEKNIEFLINIHTTVRVRQLVFIKRAGLDATQISKSLQQ